MPTTSVPNTHVALNKDKVGELLPHKSRTRVLPETACRGISQKKVATTSQEILDAVAHIVDMDVEDAASGKVLVWPSPVTQILDAAVHRAFYLPDADQGRWGPKLLVNSRDLMRV